MAFCIPRPHKIGGKGSVEADEGISKKGSRWCQLVAILNGSSENMSGSQGVRVGVFFGFSCAGAIGSLLEGHDRICVFTQIRSHVLR
jgi:hypothetical protein